MRYLGLDYGHKRIGIAVSDPLGFMAMPIEIIHRESNEKDMVVLRELIEQYSVEKVILGLPMNMDGSEGPLAEHTRSYGKKIEEALKIAVDYFDERLTTAQSERMLVEEADMSREKRKKIRDKIAATYMLQAYLDSHQK